MKIIRYIIPFLFLTGFIINLLYTSCANQGMPTGGPQDSIPPVLVRSDPPGNGLNFYGNEIRLTFNEYIIHDEVANQLVVSPPLENRPTIRLKGKNLLITFNEELKEDVTYSLDFKNSIVDNNERNPLTDFRFAFSTGNTLDSLRVSGQIKNASNLNPVENALVLLHRNLDDTAVFTQKPFYIARTNEEGIFLFDHIASGEYRIYSINDNNSDLLYNEGSEDIAFYEETIIPAVIYEESPDTTLYEGDTLIISGQLHYSPDPVYLLQFIEDVYNQFIISSKRETQYKCSFIFSEPVKDSFSVKLLSMNATDWYIIEKNTTVDSINLWITDTMIANLDTFNIEILYPSIDSIGNQYIQTDTLDLSFPKSETEERTTRRRRNEEESDEEEPIEQFDFTKNIRSSNFDINQKIILNSPEPIKEISKEGIHLFMVNDSIFTPLDFTLSEDSLYLTRYYIEYPWEGYTDYQLEIDSAAARNIYGITNRKSTNSFRTQKEDYYGKIIVAAENVDNPIIIQVLKNDVEESIIRQKIITENTTIEFNYLRPDEYLVKFIFDENNNGIWDKGSFQDKIQPEKVSYLQTVIKLKSNFENREFFDALYFDPTFPKSFIELE